MKKQVDFDALGGGGGNSIAISSGAICDSSGRVECGFEPKHIMMASQKYNGSSNIMIFCEGGTSATQFKMYYNGSESTQNVEAGKQIVSIDSTGFTLGYGSMWNNASGYMLVTDS